MSPCPSAGVTRTRKLESRPSEPELRIASLMGKRTPWSPGSRTIDPDTLTSPSPGSEAVEVGSPGSTGVTDRSIEQSGPVGIGPGPVNDLASDTPIVATRIDNLGLVGTNEVRVAVTSSRVVIGIECSTPVGVLRRLGSTGRGSPLNPEPSRRSEPERKSPGLESGPVTGGGSPSRRSVGPLTRPGTDTEPTGPRSAGPGTEPGTGPSAWSSVKLARPIASGPVPNLAGRYAPVDMGIGGSRSGIEPTVPRPRNIATVEALGPPRTAGSGRAVPELTGLRSGRAGLALNKV